MAQPKKGSWQPGQWRVEYSVTEREVMPMVKSGSVTRITLHQHSEVLWYVTLDSSLRVGSLYLAGMRTREEPRMFKSLNKLVAYIATHHPTLRFVTVEIDRRKPENQAIRAKDERRQHPPEPAASKKSPTARKTATVSKRGRPAGKRTARA